MILSTIQKSVNFVFIIKSVWVGRQRNSLHYNIGITDIDILTVKHLNHKGIRQSNIYKLMHIPNDKKQKLAFMFHKFMGKKFKNC